MAVKEQEEMRHYNFSDGTLEQLGGHVKESIQRDLTPLAPRGVVSGTVNDLDTLVNNFNALPTAGESVALVTTATETKDAKKDAALLKARTLRTAAENVWGVSKSKYKRFGFTGMDKAHEDRLPRILWRMWRAGTALQTELAGEGIDTTFLNDFNTAITDFHTALIDIDKAEELRDKQTEQLIEAGNILYKEIVRLCNIGKDFFAPVSQSFYADYVIENFTGTGETLADNYDIITYTVPTGASIIFPEPPGGGIPADTDIYLRAVNGSIKVCTTTLPADPCTSGYSLLMAKTYAGLFAELGLDMTKTHIQFTNPGLTDVKVRAGLKKE